MSTILHPVEFKIECNLDQLDTYKLQSQVINVVEQLDSNTNVFNVIKVILSDECRVDQAAHLMETIITSMKTITEDELKNVMLIPVGGRCGIQDINFEIKKVVKEDIIKDLFDRLNQDIHEFSHGFIDENTFLHRLRDIEFEYRGKYQL